MISVTVDSLKLRFLKKEVLGLEKRSLLERRRAVTQLVWSSPHQAENVNSIWSPLPYPKKPKSDNEHDLFITPSKTPSTLSPRTTASQINCLQKERQRKKDL